ncbi:metallophosphoesterase [Aeromicrobium sp. CTD01-1L150]|uniref:metallophosphoesterase family protein n=1 Tax=Aeromicrobium sp. CTD01-1L150 TaxID=3341830 RepID=UPI0035BED24D
MRRVVLGALAALLLGLAVGVPVALASFQSSERELAIGPHQATVRPAFDGQATIDFGPLLPLVRLPVDAPGGIGVDIRLGEAQVASIEELVQQDAVIASQPQGEIAAVRAEVMDMATVAAARGLGTTLIVTVVAAAVWRGLGPMRRRRLMHDAMHPGRRQVVGGVAVASCVVLGIVLIVVPPPDGEAPQTRWVPARDVFPELPANDVLEALEISYGSITRGSRALVEGALYLYQDSVDFYGELVEAAQEAEVRTPQDDESTALVVADRHDNIGMDPVARAIADQAEANLLINLGDDTSQGDTWERFSINSLAGEFEEFDRVAVAGNHDSETTIGQLEDAGFVVLEGEPVEVGGVRFLGESDPRGTTIAGYVGTAEQRDTQLSDQDVALTETACEADDAGERVGVVAVHSWASVKQVAASGCADLLLSGHLHYQVGPQPIEGEGEVPSTRLTIGSTGGAVLPIALGSSLRRNAQVSVVTFDAEGVPVGLQVVTFTPSGSVDVDDYVELPLPEEEAEVADDPDEPDNPEDEEERAP